jgi:nitrite reductase/ring-hydroxylating ferredoxin subunit
MTGAYLSLVGVVAALVAAIPGFVDYFGTVPPNSSGKRRATKHMMANLAAVTLFAIAWASRGESGAVPGVTVLALEGVGLALLTAGGWMGGVLVNRDQIGVDHRYARAGKWKEESIAARSGQPVVAARADELQVNQMKLLRIDGRRLVLARTEEGYVAFDDRCTHRGGSLAGGVMIGGVVQCPWHGSQFDCRSGLVRAGPAEQPIGSYPVTEREGKVMLSLA